jgi:predicted secreted Zn-dependent protease
LKRLFIPFVVLVSGILRAEPEVETTFAFYNIFPNSTVELSKEMRKRSPIKRDGKAFDAYTEWHVEWNYRWNKKDGMCVITKVNTSLDVTYRLPRIAKNHPAPPNVRQAFKNYSAALFKHEKNHMKSGLNAAREVEKALLNLGSFETCDQLEASANTLGNDIVHKYNELDKEYDRKTDHGKTEGVDINQYL